MSTKLTLTGGLTTQGKLDVRVDTHSGLIEAVGPQLDVEGSEVVDIEGCLLWPGMVNTHHHLAQSILKGMPAGINCDLNQWLPAVPFAAWPHFDADTLYAAACIGFSEMLLSGATTCADHHYLYQLHYGEELEDALLQAAQDVGIRMVLCRGGATTSGSHLGLLQANIVNEDLDTMLKRLDDTRLRRHDPAANAMLKLVVAPTSLIHGSPPHDLVELSRYARSHGLKLHSHLLEVPRDNDVAWDSHGMSALDYAESIEWLGEDVWFAHLVHVDDPGLAKLAATGTGIAHCPTSNCRLGSGISRVTEMAAAGVPVSLGVDGSASAESGSMANEAMLAWLLHRAVQGPSATTLEQVAGWATEGGARLLGLDTGRIEIGACADLVVYDLSSQRYAGVWQRAFAPVLCGEPVRVDKVMINGRWVVEDNRTLGLPDNVETLIRNAFTKLKAKLS